MKKNSIVIFLVIIGFANLLNAQEFKKWTISVPGYNIGTTYSYYQPLLVSFQNEQIKNWLKLDPVKDRRTVWNQGFIVRYSITPDLQIGLHCNTQLDQWTGSTTTNSYALNTNVNLMSYLPTAVLVFKKQIGKGYFSIGGGIGYYAVSYQDNQNSFTVVAGIVHPESASFQLQTQVGAGGLGTQSFLEFGYPVFQDLFFFNLRAGYVFCIIPQPLILRDNTTGKNYSYYLPDIDLSGLLATAGFTMEF